MKATSLWESGLLIKSVSKTIENKVKEQKGGFFQNVIRRIMCCFIMKSINR